MSDRWQLRQNYVCLSVLLSSFGDWLLARSDWLAQGSLDVEGDSNERIAAQNVNENYN